MCCLKLFAFLPYILYLTAFTFFERAECSVPGAQCRVPVPWDLGLGTWNSELGTFCLVLSAGCCVPGSWDLELVASSYLLAMTGWLI